MTEDADVVGYAQPRSTTGSIAPLVALALVGVQLVWLWPAVLAEWVLLCNHGLIDNWPANLTGAAVVTAPSLAAAAVALPVLLRRHGQPRTAALVATIGSLAFIVYVFTATVHDLLHPGPYPCG